MRLNLTWASKQAYVVPSDRVQVFVQVQGSLMIMPGPLIRTSLAVQLTLVTTSASADAGPRRSTPPLPLLRKVAAAVPSAAAVRNFGRCAGGVDLSRFGWYVGG